MWHRFLSAVPLRECGTTITIQAWCLLTMSNRGVINTYENINGSFLSNQTPDAKETDYEFASNNAT